MIRRPWRPGQPLRADRLTDMDRAIPAGLTGVAGMSSHQIGSNVVFEGPGTAPITPRALPLFQITGIQDDYLECLYFNPIGWAPGSRAISVAKPFLLRRWPLDGSTITYENGDVISYVYASGRERTATKGAETEVQVMTPDYALDEIIRGLPGPTGDTDLAGISIVYEDANTCGRFWARQAS